MVDRRPTPIRVRCEITPNVAQAFRPARHGGAEAPRYGSFRNELSVLQHVLEELHRALVAGLTQPEQRLTAHLRARVSLGQSDERVDAAIADQCQHEGEVFAKVVVGIVTGEPLDHGGASLATRGAQPEGGVATQVAHLAGRDQLGQRRIR